MNALPNQTDILIVGAGPTGLALATELRRLGANPIIIDKQAEGANTSRACVVHARTLEVLTPVGATRKLLEQGIQVPIFRVRDRDRALMTVDFGEIDSEYPFTLMIPQSDVEKCLLESFSELKGEVIRDCELMGFTAGAEQVDVRLRVDGVERSIADAMAGRLRRHAQPGPHRIRRAVLRRRVRRELCACRRPDGLASQPAGSEPVLLP